MSHPKKSVRLLVITIKVLLSASILVYLMFRIQSQSGFSRLVSEPKNWGALAAAQGFVVMAFSLSFVRWYLLVRGLRLPFHLRDAFRLGTLGFMLNQVSPGSIGGDLFKAVCIAREQHGKRTEAVATVVIDRVVGLYAMLLVASTGLLLVGHLPAAGKIYDTTRAIIWCAAAGGTAGLALVLTPVSTGDWVRNLVKSLPLIGATLTRLLDAVAMYRTHRGHLFAALVVAITTHTLLVLAFWCVGQGLPVDGPPFATNAAIVPMSLVAGALPGLPGGLGAMEGSLEFLYTKMGATQGDGTMVALAYRAMTYVMAMIGACYYLTARRKMDQILLEAEHFEEELEEDMSR